MYSFLMKPRLTPIANLLHGLFNLRMDIIRYITQIGFPQLNVTRSEVAGNVLKCGARRTEKISWTDRVNNETVYTE
jgi:hypothetical protein